MASVASEPHLQMGIVEEGPGGKVQSVPGRGVVTEGTGPGRIGNVVAVVTALGGGQGEAPMFRHRGMAGLTIKPGVHGMPPMGEGPPLPGNHAAPVHTEVA